VPGDFLELFDYGTDVADVVIKQQRSAATGRGLGLVSVKLCYD